MKLLCLFAGTRSVEKVFEDKGWECRGVDIDNQFKPYYNVDILTWDYKSINFMPDYIHASPCCKFFSIVQNMHKKHNKEDGLILFRKTLEIINYFRHINPNLKITIENPVNKTTTNFDLMRNYNRVKTSYCKYGFKYRKHTYIWYKGFDLQLKDSCCKKDSCVQSKETGRHPVLIGYKPPDKCMREQMLDGKWFIALKKAEPTKYALFKREKYFRYRLPELLVKDIYNQIIM